VVAFKIDAILVFLMPVKTVDWHQCVITLLLYWRRTPEWSVAVLTT